MTIAALIDTLRRAGISPTAREVAEALWLARHHPAPPLPEQPPAARPVTSAPAEEPPSAPAPNPDKNVPIAAPGESATAGPSTGFPVRSPTAPGLPSTRHLLRALRPLRQRVPDRRRLALDVAGTVQTIAGTGIWAPVLTPARERRFDAVLAVDESASMRVWRHLATDLSTLLVRTGAFRDVRVRRLLPTPDGLMLATGTDQPAIRPGQMVDGAGRRIFFVLTDAAGNAWHDGSAASQLVGWARSGPMVVVQPLPERMWVRTGLPVQAARVSAPGTGVPNTGLRVAYRRRRPAGVPVPVVGLEPTALRSWSRLVAGRAGAVSLAVAAFGPAITPRTAPPASAPGGTLQRFRATASPQAYKLAVCLSLVPVTVDTMRIVQQVAVPGSNPSALAEVLLGGLLLRTGEESYDFTPGIREDLLTEIRRSEAAVVLTAISTFIAERAGTAAPTSPAVALRAGGPLQVPAEAFAWVPEAAARRLGLRKLSRPSAVVTNSAASTRLTLMGFIEPGNIDLQGIDILAHVLPAVLGAQAPAHGLTSLVGPVDRLFAQAVLAMGGRLDVVLTVDGAAEPESDPMVRELLGQATSVTRLAVHGTSLAARAVVNREIAERSHRLLAVWDGRTASEPGETVAWAIRQGKQVQVVWASDP